MEDSTNRWSTLRIGSVVFGVLLSPGSVVRFVHELVVAEEHDIQKVDHEGGEGQDEEVSPQGSTHDSDEDEDDEESQLTDVSSGREHLFNFNIIINFNQIITLNLTMVEGKRTEEYKLILRIHKVQLKVKEDINVRVEWSRGQRTAKTKGFKLKPD